MERIGQMTNHEPILVKPAEAAPLLRVKLAKFYQLMAMPEYRACVVTIPGVRGKRVHVGRLREIVEKQIGEIHE